MNTDNTIIRQLEFELVRRPPKCRSCHIHRRTIT